MFGVVILGVTVGICCCLLLSWLCLNSTKWDSPTGLHWLLVQKFRAAITSVLSCRSAVPPGGSSCLKERKEQKMLL